MKTIKDIYYTSDNRPRQSLDVHLPESATGFPNFVFFHGGGLEQGSKDRSRIFVDYATEHGVAVICANYRLYPEAVYPDFIRDAAAAVAWAHKHMPEYGGDGRIFVGGSSAGGYLSMMLCFDRRYLGLYDMKPTDITGFIHDAGQPTSHFNVMRERGFDRRRVAIDDAAPIYYIGDSESYPPMLFTEASNDLVNRREQTDLLFSTLKHFDYSFDTIERYTFADSTHSSYVKKVDEDGVSVFAPVVYEFMKKYL